MCGSVTHSKENKMSVFVSEYKQKVLEEINKLYGAPDKMKVINDRDKDFYMRVSGAEDGNHFGIRVSEDAPDDIYVAIYGYEDDQFWNFDIDDKVKNEQTFSDCKAYIRKTIKCGSCVTGMIDQEGSRCASVWLNDKENFTENDLREYMKSFAWMIQPSEIEYTNFSGDNKIKIQYTAEDIEKNKDYPERKIPSRYYLD